MTGVATPGAATPWNLKMDRTPDAEGVVLALTGELDLASSPTFERRVGEIEATNPGRLLIDLSGLDFMDSTGIAVMIRAQRSAQANGHRLSLRQGPAHIRRLFELTGLLDHFTFED